MNVKTNGSTRGTAIARRRCWRRSSGAPPTSRSPSSCPRTGRSSSLRCGSCPPASPPARRRADRLPGVRTAPSGGARAVLALFNFGLFFPLLAVAVYRLPGGVAAAAAGGLQPLLVASLTWLFSRRRAEPSGSRDRCRGRRRRRSRRRAAQRRRRRRRRARRARRQPLVRHGRRAHQALPRAAEPARRDGMAAPARRGAARSAHARRRGSSTRRSRHATWRGSHTSASSALRLRSCVWFNGIRRLPTAAPPLLGLASPITGATLGWVVLGQSLSPVQIWPASPSRSSAIAYGATLTAERTARAPRLAVRLSA